ncbi:MAG: hypothetical protein ACRDHX_15525 [Chloroflexota bacterium]
MVTIEVLCAVAAALGLAGSFFLRRVSAWVAAGLLIGGLAAIAYAVAMTGSGAAFRVYYALGASMFPGLVGAGCCWLAFDSRTARWPSLFVLLLCLAQLALTLPAQVNPAGLAALYGGNGAGVLVMGPWVIPTVLFNTFGLGFALVSALAAWWRAFRGQEARMAALAIGLSVVVLGILARSDGVYQALSQVGGRSAFPLLDAVAFALVWLGALATRALIGPLSRAALQSAAREFGCATAEGKGRNDEG